MRKKSFFTVWIFICLFSTILIGGNPPEASKFQQDREAIVALIKSGQIDSAKIAVDKFITDFPTDALLPETLCWFAEEYGYAGKLYEEKNIYQQILRNYPDNSIADKVKLGLESSEVRSFIASENFKYANETLEKLLIDFNNNPALPNVLYRLARGYEWGNRYAEAGNIFKQIIQNYSQSSLADTAQLGFRRSEIRSLILSATNAKGPLLDSNLSAEYLAKADVAINKLIIDFNNNPALADALYYIAQRYGYSGRFDEEKKLYRRIIDDFPNNSYADKAKVDLAGAEVLTLVLSNDNNDPKLSSEASAKSKEALEKFITGFSDNPYLIKTMLRMAEKCYEKGVSLDSRQEIIGTPPKPAFFIFAVDLLENHVLSKSCNMDEKADAYRMVCENYDRLGNVQKSVENAELTLQTDPHYRFAANLLYHSAISYSKLDEYEKSVDYFKKILNEYPNFWAAWKAQFMVGYNYEKMLNAGKISEAEAKPLIASQYMQILKNYPHSVYTQYIKKWMEDNQ